MCKNSCMCTQCLSSLQDFDAKPFGSVKDGSMGDKGIAMKSNTRYDGDGGTSQKFEGMAPEKSASALQAENTGRQ